VAGRCISEHANRALTVLASVLASVKAGNSTEPAARRANHGAARPWAECRAAAVSPIIPVIRADAFDDPAWFFDGRAP
jgi:hypothetical protein